MGEVISFRVVKEPYGWAVRVGQGMMTPFSSLAPAVKHANGFAEALRRRGECAEVFVDEACPNLSPPRRPARSSFESFWTLAR